MTKTKTIAIYRVKVEEESGLHLIENLITGDIWECNKDGGESIGDIIDWDWVSDEERRELAVESDALDAQPEIQT